MTNTWATKVLEGVPRHSLDFCDRIEIDKDGVWMHVDDVLDAIAKLGAGDGLVAELEMSARIWTIAADHKEAPTFSRGDCRVWAERFTNAAAHIAALTAQNREMALDVLASSGQAQEAYAAQLDAEAERDALRAKVARLEGVLTDMPKAVLRTTVCQGPQWPDDRPGVWLAALEACAKSVQAAVDAALTDGGKDG